MGLGKRNYGRCLDNPKGFATAIIERLSCLCETRWITLRIEKITIDGSKMVPKLSDNKKENMMECFT